MNTTTIDNWDNSELCTWLARESFSGLCVLRCKELGLTGAEFKLATEEDLGTALQLTKKEARKVREHRDKLLKVKSSGGWWLRARLGGFKRSNKSDSKVSHLIDNYNNLSDKSIAQPQKLKGSQSEMISGAPLRPGGNKSELFRLHKTPEITPSTTTSSAQTSISAPTTTVLRKSSFGSPSSGNILRSSASGVMSSSSPGHSSVLRNSMFEDSSSTSPNGKFRVFIIVLTFAQIHHQR